MMKRIISAFCIAVCVASAAGAQGAKTNFVASQYWTWYSPGQKAPMWDGVAYGKPVEGAYDSNDPLVASRHIKAMVDNGVNVLSVGTFNRAGDGTIWNADKIDNDKAFRNGVMKAPNFRDIKFFISYDLATRAMLVHRAENGLQWGFPKGKDVLPDVEFFDPAVAESEGANGFPSFNFNLKDKNGKWMYDELMLYDFKSFAENYFKEPNYLKINGQCVVFIYSSWRFNNGGVGEDAAGFSRALVNIRNTMYEKYGYTLYLAGDFVSYYNKGRIPYQKSQNYYGQYDAIAGWNVYDDVYANSLGKWTSLSTYTDASKRVQDAFLPEAKSATRVYRDSLSEAARAAYGSSSVALDFIPTLSFSFRRFNASSGFKSNAADTSELVKEASMVKALRDKSRMAESDSTLVYHIAFNQWNEGQVIEPMILDEKDPYPAKAGMRYLETIRDVLGF